MFCHNCGKQLHENAKFCKSCGVATDEIRPQEIFSEPIYNTQVSQVHNKYFTPIIALTSIICVIILVSIVFYISYYKPSAEYKKAIELYTAGNYDEAYVIFANLYEYKQSQEYIKKIETEKSQVEETTVEETTTEKTTYTEPVVKDVPSDSVTANNNHNSYGITEFNGLGSVEEKVKAIRKWFQAANSNNIYKKSSFYINHSDNNGTIYTNTQNNLIERITIKNSNYSDLMEVYIRNNTVYFLYMTYYDPSTGNYNSNPGEGQRFYFENGKLIRYIPQGGEIIDNSYDSRFIQAETDARNMYIPYCLNSALGTGSTISY